MVNAPFLSSCTDSSAAWSTTCKIWDGGNIFECSHQRSACKNWAQHVARQRTSNFVLQLTKHSKLFQVSSLSQGAQNSSYWYQSFTQITSGFFCFPESFEESFFSKALVYSGFLPFETHSQWIFQDDPPHPSISPVFELVWLSGFFVACNMIFNFRRSSPSTPSEQNTSQIWKAFFFQYAFGSHLLFQLLHRFFRTLCFEKPLQIPLFRLHLLQIVFLLKSTGLPQVQKQIHGKLKLWKWRWVSSGRASVTSPFVVAVLATLLFTWSTCGIFPNLSQAFFLSQALTFTMEIARGTRNAPQTKWLNKSGILAGRIYALPCAKWSCKDQIIGSYLIYLDEKHFVWKW